MTSTCGLRFSIELILSAFIIVSDWESFYHTFRFLSSLLLVLCDVLVVV
jgi:hypothetical protein